MIRFLLMCFILGATAFAPTGEAAAQSSYGGSGSYGRLGILRDGDGYLLPRRDIRQARREARQAARQARWGGSHGGYGSAGSTSHEVAEPAVEAAVYCPTEAPALECVDCPTCSKFPAATDKRLQLRL